MTLIIVGAGPAGATLALLLARRGISVTLIEQETSFDRVFRGEGLMPAGMDALLQMGLGPLLATFPSRPLESWNIHIDGREVFVIPEPMDKLGDRALRIIPQPAFLSGVVNQAQQFPSFQFMPGTQVQDLIWQGDRVTGVRVKTEQGVADLAADLVIGCDGRGSLVRRKAGLTLNRLPEQYDVLWFKLPAPERLRDRCQLFLMAAAQKYPATCYTSWDGRLQYGLILPKGGLSRLFEDETGEGAVKTGSSPDWLKAAVEAAPPWLADHVLAHHQEITSPLRLNVLVGRCPVWSAPGVLLLGDAAHPMSPVRAQGINLALRDAIVATNHLAPICAAGPTLNSPSWEQLDAAGMAIQVEREPEVVRSQKLQLREAKNLGDIRQGTWKFALAKRLVPVLGRYRWTQQAWLARQRDLRLGSTTVQLQNGAPAAKIDP